MGNLDSFLAWFFKRPTSITFIKGRKDWGKTDFGFRILEDALKDGYIAKIGSNCKTFDDPDVEFIMYHDTLIDWFQTPGKKGYLLDELGSSLYRMGFMSKQAKVILDVCQLSRKYKCHLIGIAPSEKLVNKLFMNTDILDCFIVKLGRKKASLLNIITRQRDRFINIPATTLKFDTDYISDFKLNDPMRGKRILKELPDSQRALLLYGQHHTYRKVAKIMNCSHTHVMALIKKELASFGLHSVSVN